MTDDVEKRADLSMDVLDYASSRAAEMGMDSTEVAAVLMSATAYKCLQICPDNERLIFRTAVLAGSTFRDSFIAAQRHLIELAKQVRHG